MTSRKQRVIDKLMKHQNGFTIVELMITLVVAAILLALAAPSFRDMIANNRLSGTTNQLQAALNLARGEGIKRNGLVTVSSASGSNDWSDGWSVSAGGTTIRTFEAVEGGQTVTATVSSMQFNGRGMLEGAGTPTIDVCDSRTGETGKQIQILRTGRAQATDLTCT